MKKSLIKLYTLYRTFNWYCICRDAEKCLSSRLDGPKNRLVLMGDSRLRIIYDALLRIVRMIWIVCLILNYSKHEFMKISNEQLLFNVF